MHFPLPPAPWLSPLSAPPEASWVLPESTAESAAGLPLAEPVAEPLAEPVADPVAEPPSATLLSGPTPWAPLLVVFPLDAPLVLDEPELVPVTEAEPPETPEFPPLADVSSPLEPDSPVCPVPLAAKADPLDEPERALPAEPPPPHATAANRKVQGP